MEFGNEKSDMLIMKKGNRETTEGIEQPNQEIIRMLTEKENYKYFKISETDIIKLTQMKGKVRKEYIRRTKKLLETKLCSWNLIKGACKILWTNFQIDKRVKLTNRPNNEEIDDYAQGLKINR